MIISIDQVQTGTRNNFNGERKGGHMPTATSPTTGAAIDYQKVFTERVFIKKDGPVDPDLNITGGELLHGYLCDIYRLGQKDENLKATIEGMCRKWNIYYIA